MGLYVQYGCGFDAPEEWLNFDVSPTLRFERIPILGMLYTKNKQRFPKNVRYGNIVKGLPVIQSGTCDGIYCSHVLEHLSFEDFITALKNTFKYLKPGGIFRCVIPDLKGYVEIYLERIKHKDSTASIQFMRETRLGTEKRVYGIWNLFKFLGSHEHLWMWDALSLQDYLRRTGFSQIRPCLFNDSSDPMFNMVESEKRFRNAIAFEAIK